MDTQWLAPASDRLQSFGAAVSNQLQRLAEPARARQVRLVVYAAAVAWLLWALAGLFWGLLPAPANPLPEGEVINPQVAAAGPGRRRPVSIDELAGWELFGKPGAAAPTTPQQAAPARSARPGADDRDGIEDGAEETRLQLVLQGVVASDDPEAALAVIEHQKKQQQYRVDDKLPVGGSVTLAKILPDRVVLSNKGKYELLLLFDENSRSGEPMVSVRSEAPAANTRSVDQRANRNLTEMAENYRQRLYTNPQSLADVVKISAVREGGQLQGYRVSAGKDAAQFESLGFQSNDIVTAVNGIELSDPGKAVELYKVMRSAEEASFNVRRGGEDVTLVVGLKTPEN
jgi:general secretion pathway protein C